MTADVYNITSGSTLYAGCAPVVQYGALGQAVAAMSANTMAQYFGSNVNDMVEAGQVDTVGAPFGFFESGLANTMLGRWAGKWNFDPATGIICGVGTSEGNTSPPRPWRSKNVIWNLNTDLFQAQWNPTGRAEGHCYDQNTSRPMNGYTYRRGYNSVQIFRYHVATEVWSLFYTLPSSPFGGLNAISIEVFPDMGAQGTLCLFGETGQVWTIDVASSTLTTRTSSTGTTRYSISAYIASAQCVLFGGGELAASKVWKMDTTGAISEIIQTFPTNVALMCNATGGVVLPHPNEPGLIVASDPSTALWKMTISGNVGTWTKLLDFPGWSDGNGCKAKLCVGASLHGLNAVVMFYNRGRNPTTQRSQNEIWLFKV